MHFHGIEKNALRKFEGLALKNEIDVINVWLFCQFVSRTEVWLIAEDGTYFILASASNF